jgi:hypothetical protein
MLDAIESSVIEGSLLGAARIVSQMTVSEDCLGGLSCIIDIPSEEADGARHQDCRRNFLHNLGFGDGQIQIGLSAARTAEISTWLVVNCVEGSNDVR